VRAVVLTDSQFNVQFGKNYLTHKLVSILALIQFILNHAKAALE
jgi:hypothetical protein